MVKLTQLLAITTILILVLLLAWTNLSNTKIEVERSSKLLITPTISSSSN